MAHRRGTRFARTRGNGNRPVGEVRTSVTVAGDVSGQLAVGSHIVQMRVDTVLGNLVTVLPPDARAAITPRPVPVHLVPRRPAIMIDRRQETTLAVDSLSVRRPVEIHAPPGMGKSTLLRFLAHNAPIAEVCGGVAHLSARRMSHDDLLQVLFDVFYSADIPVKPSPGELRHHLQHVRAALLLDDVELSDDEMADLEDYAPGCGFAMASTAGGGAGEACLIELSGLRGPDATVLFSHALGRPLRHDEQSAITALCHLVGGAPAGILRLAAAARDFSGTLAEFAASAVSSAAPPVPVESQEDRRLLGLLAAVPGVHLDVEQLSAVTGFPDVQHRIDRLVSHGLVLTSAEPVTVGGPVAYSLAGDLDLGQAEVWQLEQRRAELRDYFLEQAAQRSETLLAPGAPAETLRALHADAAERREWRYVLGLGALLEAAYALCGRWDAWAGVLEHSLSAARALGDQGAEAMALHQLGTRALCVGQASTATGLLRTALHLRTAIGDVAAAQVTRHNLSLIWAPPPPLPGKSHQSSAGHGNTGTSTPQDSGAHASGTRLLLGHGTIPTKVLVAATSLLVTAAVVTGVVLFRSGGSEPQLELDHNALQFAALPLDNASDAQTLTARNRGQAPVRLEHFTTAGPQSSEFVVTDTTCYGREIASGGTCSAEVVFTPAAAGSRRASLTADVRGTSRDPVSQLSGSSSGPDAASASAVPTQLAFGEQPLNRPGERRQIRIIGPSDGSVVVGAASVSGGDAADFLLEGDHCSDVQLVPGAECTVGVRFTPGAEGGRQGLLTLPLSDGRPSVTVPLSGTGAAVRTGAEFALDPRSLDFGEEPVSTASRPQTVTLTDTGHADLDTSAVSILGTPDFAVVKSSCRAALRPGQDCTVTIRFAPASAGPRTAQLVFGAAEGPAVPLSGTGLAPPSAAPILSPSVVTFGQQDIGTVSAAQQVTATNRADRPLRFTTADVQGPTEFRVDGAGCENANLGPGASCSLSVAFAPTTAAVYSGVLTVKVTGLADASVALSGIGVDLQRPQVPDVIGLSLSDARQALAAVGLVPGVITQAAHPDIARGAVAEQSPWSGRVLAVGGSVDLVVSTGPELVVVPQVVGLAESDAAAQLHGAGLTVGTVTTESDDKLAEGRVLRSDPSGGASVDRGSAVNLVVSSGPVTSGKVPVPECAGLTEQQASAALDQAGLDLGNVTRQPDESIEAGVVLSCDPPTGTQVDPGSAVNLVVSSGPSQVPVPECAGLSQAAAEASLTAAGLQTGDISTQSDESIDAGVVLSCDPPTGTQVDPGSAVNLVVSSGPSSVD